MVWEDPIDSCMAGLVSEDWSGASTRRRTARGEHEKIVLLDHGLRTAELTRDPVYSDIDYELTS